MTINYINNGFSDYLKMYKAGLLLGLILLVCSTIVTANFFPVYVRPINSTNHLQKNKLFTYQFKFTNSSSCLGPITTITRNITTDYTGAGFVNLNVSALTQPIKYICEYRNTTLKTVHNMSMGLFSNIYTTNNILSNKNITAQYFKGDGSLLTGITDTDTDTWNTTLQIRTAINVSKYFKLKIDWTNIINYTNNSKGNTTKQIRAAVNSSRLNLINAYGYPVVDTDTWNTTLQIRNAVNSSRLNLVNAYGYIETDSAHDTCAEISGCVVGAITTDTFNTSVQMINAVNSSRLDLKKSYNFKLVNEYQSTIIEEDFLLAGTSFADHMIGAPVSSGTSVAVAAQRQHPGIVYIRDSTTGNGAYYYWTSATHLLLSGNEKATFIFQNKGVRTTASTRMGFFDNFAIQTQPTDGCWFNMSTGRIQGSCKNNTGPSLTATMYTLNLSTWYKGTIQVNAAVNSVLFSIYSNKTKLLWNQSIAGNIPTALGRDTGFGIIAGETTVDAAADIVWIDYLSLVINRTLER